MSMFFDICTVLRLMLNFHNVHSSMNIMENTKSESKNKYVKVYYDGLCQLCSREINTYRNAKGAERIAFIDITDESFNPKIEGLDPKRIHQVMHVKDSSGKIMTGVDAFITIWRTLPNYNWLARIVDQSPIKNIAKIGYVGFAKVRPFLPRKKKLDCSESPYCEQKEAL